MVALTKFNGIELWDVKRNTLLSRHDADGVVTSTFSPDGHILAYTQSTEQEKRVLLWSYTEDRVQEVPLDLAPGESPEDLTFSSDGKLLGACVGTANSVVVPRSWRSSSLDTNHSRHSMRFRF